MGRTADGIFLDVRTIAHIGGEMDPAVVLPVHERLRARRGRPGRGEPAGDASPAGGAGAAGGRGAAQGRRGRARDRPAGLLLWHHPN